MHPTRLFLKSSIRCWGCPSKRSRSVCSNLNLSCLVLSSRAECNSTLKLCYFLLSFCRARQPFIRSQRAPGHLILWWFTYTPREGRSPLRWQWCWPAFASLHHVRQHHSTRSSWWLWTLRVYHVYLVLLHTSLPSSANGGGIHHGDGSALLNAVHSPRSWFDEIITWVSSRPFVKGFTSYVCF